MCSCGTPPTGQSSGALSGAMGSLNGADVHPQFGAMVLVEYRGAMAGREVIGAISGQRYQYRQGGEIFNIWEVDAKADPETFSRLAVVDRIEETVMPDAPVLMGA